MEDYRAMQRLQDTSVLQTRLKIKNSDDKRENIHRIPSNHKQAERVLIAHVKSGELRIDSQGRIWREKVRKGIKGGGSKLYDIQCRRAEHKTPLGYLQIRIMTNGKRLHGCAHRLVWQFFNGDIPGGLTINHKNGLKDDNRPENLEVTTYSENMSHAHKTGLIDQSGEKNPHAKLNDRQIVEIRVAYSQGEYTQKQLADQYNVSHQAVSKIVRGDRRKQQLGITADYKSRRQRNTRQDSITGQFV